MASRLSLQLNLLVVLDCAPLVLRRRGGVGRRSKHNPRIYPPPHVIQRRALCKAVLLNIRGIIEA